MSSKNKTIITLLTYLTILLAAHYCYFKADNSNNNTKIGTSKNSYLIIVTP